MTLTPQKLDAREQRFCEEYLLDLDPKAAAIRAGYAPSTANCKAWGWVSGSKPTKPHVLEAIEKAKAARSKRTAVSQDWVLNHIHGTVERCLEPGDAFQPSAALKGLYLAGKHLGMFGTTLRHAGHDGGSLTPDDRSVTEAARRVAYLLAAGAEIAKKDKDSTDG